MWEPVGGNSHELMACGSMPVVGGTSLVVLYIEAIFSLLTINRRLFNNRPWLVKGFMFRL